MERFACASFFCLCCISFYLRKMHGFYVVVESRVLEELRMSVVHHYSHGGLVHILVKTKWIHTGYSLSARPLCLTQNPKLKHKTQKKKEERESLSGKRREAGGGGGRGVTPLLSSLSLSLSLSFSLSLSLARPAVSSPFLLSSSFFFLLLLLKGFRFWNLSFEYFIFEDVKFREL